MKRNILNTAIFSLCVLATQAQTVTKNPTACKFTTVLQAGILEGQADKTYGQFQLLGGIQRNAWFYGLGLGVDYYGAKRSVPLFLDVKKELSKKSHTPFVYADAGYNFSWLRDQEKINYWGTDYKASGGVYYETGFGYKFRLKNKVGFGFSAGYSVKQQNEFFKPYSYIDIMPLPQPLNNKQLPDKYHYTYRRISLKFNCSF